MKKKMISLLLVLAFCMGFAVQALATGTSSETIDIGIQNKILRVLAAAEAEKEHYGLQSADFSLIAVGHEIPTYRVDNGNLIDAELQCLPVIVGDKMVAMLYVVQVSDEEVFVQLSKGLVTPIYQYVDEDDAFAIIYDDEGAYVSFDGTLFFLGKATSEDESKNSKNLVSAVTQQNLQTIATEEVKTEFTLDVSSYMQSLAQSRTTQAAYLPVEIIAQPDNTNICWAIASACIINYVKSKSYTYEDIVDKVTGGTQKGLNTVQTIQGMNDYYAMNYTPKNGASINKDLALQQLLAGYPIYGDFVVYTGITPGPAQPSGGGHAVVIRGINLLTSTFSVMNPASNITDYTMGSFSGGTWKFVSDYDGRTWELRSYGHYKG